ncbi:MAG: ABC transporter transmembrane domain-containing protein, partial [Verrucomicrobiales bacterium]|nr:ABC transporter transmembrane domain-containing protein [Verrucomicrobiales bacterium]
MTSTSRSLAPRVWQRLQPYRPRLLASLALLLVSVPLINFHPLVWGIVGDHLLDGTLTSEILTFWLATMALTYAVGLVTNAAHSYLLEKTGQAFVRDARNSLFEKFQSQSIAYHRDSSSGELVTRLVSDVDAMEQSVLQG